MKSKHYIRKWINIGAIWVLRDGNGRCIARINISGRSHAYEVNIANDFSQALTLQSAKKLAIKMLRQKDYRGLTKDQYQKLNSMS